MSWHLRSIQHNCQRCGRRATVELYNTYNAPSGRYCTKCGALELKKWQAREKEE